MPAARSAARSGQPALEAAPTGLGKPILDTLLLHEPVIGRTRPKRGFGSSSLHRFPFPYCLAEAGVVDGLARVHKLTFKVGQDQLAVPIPLVPLPGELRQLRDCFQLLDHFDKIRLDIGGDQYLSAGNERAGERNTEVTPKQTPAVMPPLPPRVREVEMKDGYGFGPNQGVEHATDIGGKGEHVTRLFALNQLFDPVHPPSGELDPKEIMLRRALSRRQEKGAFPRTDFDFNRIGVAEYILPGWGSEAGEDRLGAHRGGSVAGCSVTEVKDDDLFNTVRSSGRTRTRGSASLIVILTFGLSVPLSGQKILLRGHILTSELTIAEIAS